MLTRLGIAALVFMMMQAVLFGIGVVTILATPLSHEAARLIPGMIVLTMLVSLPLSWWLAPRLRARYWRRHDAKHGADKVLSGMV